MKTFRHSILVLIVAATFAGCAHTEQSKSPDLPPPTISNATFQLGHPYTVVITGEFFKIKSDSKKDVLVSLNGRNWEAAKSITNSSPVSYTADLPYGINFPQVWVRVYGLNEEYSGPFLVHGQK